jgi:hypothetical protein
MNVEPVYQYKFSAQLELLLCGQRQFRPVGRYDGHLLTENCCCVRPATALVSGASLTLGRLAISDPLRRYRGDVATGRRSDEAFEGEVVTVCEIAV